MALTILEGSTFCICDERGDLDGETCGLFADDTRFLSLLRLTINGAKPLLLSSGKVEYFSAAFYLRNPQRSEAVGGSVVYMQHNTLLTRLLPGLSFGNSSSSNGFSATGQFIRFPPGYASSDKDRLDIDEAWIAGAEIVVVRATAGGSVPRALEIPDFPLRVKVDHR